MSIWNWVRMGNWMSILYLIRMMHSGKWMGYRIIVCWRWITVIRYCVKSINREITNGGWGAGKRWNTVWGMINIIWCMIGRRLGKGKFTSVCSVNMIMMRSAIYSLKFVIIILYFKNIIIYQDVILIVSYLLSYQRVWM